MTRARYGGVTDRSVRYAMATGFAVDLRRVTARVRADGGHVLKDYTRRAYLRGMCMDLYDPVTETWAACLWTVRPPEGSKEPDVVAFLGVGHVVPEDADECLWTRFGST